MTQPVPVTTGAQLNATAAATAPPPAPTAKPAAATPPPANGAPPAPETPAEKPPETPAEGKLYAQLRAREKAFVERQQRERHEFEQERSRFERERGEVAAERQRLEAERVARIEQESQAQAQRDPLRWFQKQQADKIAALEAKIGGLEAKIEGYEKSTMGERQQAAVDREFSKFQSEAVASSEHTHVQQYAKSQPDRFRARTIALASEHVAQGIRLTNAEILDKLEEDLALEASIWKPAAHSPDSASTSSDTGQTSSTAESKPALTLTGARAGERTKDLSEAELSKLSPADRREYTLAKLRELRAQREAAKAGKP